MQLFNRTTPYFAFAATILMIVVASLFASRIPFPNEPSREAIGEAGKAQSGTETSSRTDYYVSGKGPDVVLHASLGRETSDFNELINVLNSANYRTIAIEAPGIRAHSLAKSPMMDSFANSVSLAEKFEARGPVIKIGHAFGNRVVRMSAHQNPENTKAVILLAAGGQVPMEPKAEQSLKNIFNPLKSSEERMKDIEYAFFAEGNDIPDHWKRGWHTKTAMAQGKAVAASAGDESWHCAGGVPMLIIQPMQDRIAPIENAYALRDKCPQEVEIVKIENAGHALLPEQPDAVAEAVLAYLAKHHPVE